MYFIALYKRFRKIDWVKSNLFKRLDFYFSGFTLFSSNVEKLIVIRIRHWNEI